MDSATLIMGATFRTTVPSGPDGKHGGNVDRGRAHARGAGIVGVLTNGLAHRNRGGTVAMPDDVAAIHAAPTTPAELDGALARFANSGVSTVVIDGGDGTVRDVLSRAPEHFTVAPRLAILRSGKTNALAVDLGIPANWTIGDAVQAAQDGAVVRRHPLEIRRTDAERPHLRGFLFGKGAFVRATALAQGTHRMGAFNGVAVGLSLLGAVGQTLLGGRSNAWRRGDRIEIDLPDGRHETGAYYLLLASTLERLPLGLKPFGRVRPGLKLLAVDAPPKRLALTLPSLLAGAEHDWIAARGYRRIDTPSFALRCEGDFILDGELYPGGDVIVQTGAPIDFVVPST